MISTRSSRRFVPVIIAGLTCLAMVQQASADLTRAGCAPVSVAVVQCNQDRGYAATEARLARTLESLRSGSRVPPNLHSAQQSADPADEHPAALRIPPLPNSTTLAISGLLSAAAVHVLRNAKRISVTPIPEWYHTDGPIQVGHSHVYDLNTTGLPLCPFASPTDGAGKWLCFISAPVQPVCGPQRVLSVDAPRGPPAN